MSRINTNVNSLIAQRILTQKQDGLTKSLERLSTGLAISRGADNPAGLIASEKLRSEKAALSAAIGNAQRAEQVVNIAEGGLTEIQSLLTDLQSLVGETANDAGLSTEEKEANQLQIDQILASIDRIASTTSFEGTKLLNGKYDFQVSSVDSDVIDYKINAAKIEEGGSVAVKALVTTSARHAVMQIDLSGGSLVLDDGADSRFVFELGGAKGSRTFSFASGTAIADIVAGVNQFASITGVSAATQGANDIRFKSREFGSDDFVSFRVITRSSQAGAVHTMSSSSENVRSDEAANITDFAALTAPVRAEGVDVGAIINGNIARGKGLTASVTTDALDVSITLNSGATGAQGVSTVSAFTVTGGGAKFNLGPNVDMGNQVRLGVANVAARNLGSKLTGYIDELGSGRSANVVNGDLDSAQEIVNKAIDQVSSLRGRLGAFQKFTVGSTISALGIALENTSAAEAAIRDTDFASETANMTRSQILVSAATNVLSIANSSPQNVLRLLG